MQEVHLILPEITALIIAFAALISAFASAVATVLGAVNHRRMEQMRDGQKRIETAVNGRVEELAAAKAGQAIISTAIAAGAGRVVLSADPAAAAAEEVSGHVQ